MESGIFLLLGSNVGDRKQYLTTAKELITKHVGRILRMSSIYRTAAWGNTSQTEFFNQVIEIETIFAPELLLEKILGIETMMGRIRAEKWGPRLIDIDLLFYKHTILNSPQLTLPHPEIQNRKFTLIPLAELAPDFLHPLLNTSVKVLLIACKDTLEVQEIE